MNQPILEALSFSLEKKLVIKTSATAGSRPAAAVEDSWAAPPTKVSTQQLLKNSKTILPSNVILDETCPIPCFMPTCSFTAPAIVSKSQQGGGGLDEFLAHLLTEHRLVIDGLDGIANLHKYVVYWKEKFSQAPVTTYCVGFVMDDLPSTSNKRVSGTGEASGTSGEDGRPTYYMITPALPEDKQLRDSLWNDRLATVLEVNKLEREQTDFSGQCLLCAHVFKGNRTLLFEHMKTDHSFYIGKPDNVVFVEEFLQLISSKLDKLICLSCEKVFKDKPTLRDHMRKKGHRRLNRNNSEYDRFYVVNYLEPGKNWKMLEEEDQEDDRVEEDWIETEEKLPIVCLLCPYQSSSFQEVLKHMDDEHRCDFQGFTSHCDFYQKVKIVNFIRRSVFLNMCLVCEKKILEGPADLLVHLKEHFVTSPGTFAPPELWDQPEYYFPTYENDQFLVMLGILDKDGAGADDKYAMTFDPEDKPLVIPEDLPTCLDKNSSVLKDMDLS